MTGFDVLHCQGLDLAQGLDEKKVQALVKSILENGWKGCPILVYGESLLTGNHRQEALGRIYNMVLSGEIDDAPVLDDDSVAEDVTEIVEKNLKAAEELLGYIPEIDYSNIGWLLKGSWVEKYKDEIVEW